MVAFFWGIVATHHWFSFMIKLEAEIPHGSTVFYQYQLKREEKTIKNIIAFMSLLQKHNVFFIFIVLSPSFSVCFPPISQSTSVWKESVF